MSISKPLSSSSWIVYLTALSSCHPTLLLLQQQPQPASEVFCPALEGQTSSPTLGPPVDITVPTPPPSASAPTSPDGTPTESPVNGPPDTSSPTKRPTSKKPSSAISGSGSNDYDVDPESIGHGAKAGKPYKIPDGLSMPGNGLIMDHFDLSTSRSGKRRQLDSPQNRRNTNSQGSRFMMKKRDRRQQDTDEEAFGTHRRIAKHREEAAAHRRRDVLFVDENVEEEEEPIVMTKVDSRRLRRN